MPIFAFQDFPTLYPCLYPTTCCLLADAYCFPLFYTLSCGELLGERGEEGLLLVGRLLLGDGELGSTAYLLVGLSGMMQELGGDDDGGLEVGVGAGED